MKRAHELTKKRLYRVKWPDGNVELIAADDEEELFLILDEEAPPFDAEIEEVELGTMRINPRNRLLVFREIMELPIKRKLTKADLERALVSLYGVPQPILLH